MSGDFGEYRRENVHFSETGLPHQVLRLSPVLRARRISTGRRVAGQSLGLEDYARIVRNQKSISLFSTAYKQCPFFFSFWPILIADTIPLLESADPKIPSRESVQIIHHLETQLLPILHREREYQKIHDKSRILHNTRLDDVDKLIKLIRGASARNLSRMLIIENTIAL